MAAAVDGPCDDCGGAQPMGRGWQPGIDGAPLCIGCWSRWHAAERPSAYPPKPTGPCACCAVERPNKAGRWRRGRTADESLCSTCCTRWREAGRPSELVAAGRGPCACGETPLGAGWKRGLTAADGTQEYLCGMCFASWRQRGRASTYPAHLVRSRAVLYEYEAGEWLTWDEAMQRHFGEDGAATDDAEAVVADA
jgi:hypothetical protein